MDLHLVLLPMIVAASLASTERCASSPGSTMDLSLHSQKNSSGHWIITVNTQRSILTENQRELIVNVHQETRLCGSNEIEQLISMTTVYPPVHDTPIPGDIQPSTTATTTSTTTTTRRTLPSTTATPSITTTTRTIPSTTATPSTTTTTTTATATTLTTRPKSCPHAGYQLFPELSCYKAFNSEDGRKTWSEARQQCRRDGGDLMVMETERERKDVFIPLYKSVSWIHLPWVGVYTLQATCGWMTVRGEPALSTWWEPRYPREGADTKCALAINTGLLRNVDCRAYQTFICEIPL